MRWLIGVMALVSCSPTSPSDLPTAYEEQIRLEWRQTQTVLSSLDVDANVMIPEMCTWVPSDGMFKSDASWTGWAEGEFDPNTFTIRWNVNLPGVICHEAGHAILHYLNHSCASCVAIDGCRTVFLHPGPKCDPSRTRLGQMCERWLKEVQNGS